MQPSHLSLFPLATSPHPEATKEPTKSHLLKLRTGFIINNKRCPPLPYHLVNYKGFGSSVLGTGDKTKYVFLIKSQYHRGNDGNFFLEVLYCRGLLMKAIFSSSDSGAQQYFKSLPL